MPRRKRRNITVHSSRFGLAAPIDLQNAEGKAVSVGPGLLQVLRCRIVDREIRRVFPDSEVRIEHDPRHSFPLWAEVAGGPETSRGDVLLIVENLIARPIDWTAVSIEDAVTLLCGGIDDGTARAG